MLLEVIIALIILVVIYLYYKYNRVCSDDLSEAWHDLTDFTSNSSMLLEDVQHFSQHYDKHSKTFIEARLDKRNEYTQVFLILKDAMNKGKQTVSYRDVPNSPKMYSAFSELVFNPDQFFAQLASQSAIAKKETDSFVGNQSNVSNLGLQIVNDVREHDRAKYTPTPPSSSWKYIERSRGPH